MQFHARFGFGYKAALAACFLLPAAGAYALTATSTFTVSVQLNATCLINSASALTFLPQGVLSTNVNQTSTIQVTCTNTTPYNIGLDAGTGAGATVAPTPVPALRPIL